MNTPFGRVRNYLRAGTLAERWKLCSEPRRKYAIYLVEKYGYNVSEAVERSYIHGFDLWPYDHKINCCVEETHKREDFGFERRDTMHYYAFLNSYGIGTRHADGGRIGTLKVFDSKRERDAWVDADTWDGNYHREPVSSHEARRIMLDMLYSLGVFDPVFDAPSMQEIVEEYRELVI